MVQKVVLVLWLTAAAWGQQTPTADQQLQAYKDSTDGPGVLTTSAGAPVRRSDADNSLQTELTDNMHLMEKMFRFNRERIPQRVVCGKGAGAKGYFKVTHDVTHITNVAFLSRVGKVTPVATRFSPSTSDRGSPDTLRNTFTISAKFYTEEGNWDFLGFTADIMFIKDPLFFPSAFHGHYHNPQTALPDITQTFDFFLSRPESLPFFLIIFGDPGVPATYRNMPAFPIHTFQLENDCGDISYVRFKLIPDAGEAYMNQTQAFTLAGTQPDYFTADMYNTIASGKFPTWTLAWQVIPEGEADEAGFNIWDVTMRWPETKYPFQPIGTLTLNENPKNHFADVEQLSFNPGQVVPGMQGCDPMLRVRTWAYIDAANHRLGGNYNRIKVNSPLTPVLNYNRDGAAPVGANQCGAPNYYPNSFNGPQPLNSTRTRSKACRPYIGPEVSNYGQAAEYYENLSQDSKDRLASNTALVLSLANTSVQQRAVKQFGSIDARLGAAIKAGLEALAAEANAATAG